MVSVVMFINDPDLDRKGFHWRIYNLHNVSRGGCKYHIKGLLGVWYTDYGVTYGVYKSFLLTELVQIAAVPPRTKAYTDQIIQKA